MHHTYTLHVCYTCAACELLIHCRPLRWPSATRTRWADSRWMNRYMFELIRTYRRELSSAELHVSMIYLPIYLRRAMLRRSRSHGRRWAGKRSAGGLVTRASAASLALTVRSARRRPSRWKTCQVRAGKCGFAVNRAMTPRSVTRRTALSEVVSALDAVTETTAARVAYTHAPSPRYRGRCREHGRGAAGP